MAFSLSPKHFKRYKHLGWLLIKYGRADLLKGSDIEEDTEALPEPKAEELAADLEALGPTFVKLGQLLSTRADFLPAPYRAALTRLQDDVAPFPYEEVEAIVPVEIGARISKAFAHFEREPMAAASLGQVHRATLRDGRRVAVKIQRPGIRERVLEDLESMDEIAGFLDAHTEAGRLYEFSKMMEELRRSLMRELDYRQEAANLATLREKMVDFPRIVVPAPIEDFTSSRVLTMEYISGKNVTSLSPLARMDVDGAGLAEELFRAYLRQILVDGFFHADPHPGNVLLTDDHRVALIDLGMTARIGPRLQEDLLQLLLAISEGRSDDAATTAIKIGTPRDDFNEPGFRAAIGELVGRQQDATVLQMQVGRVVLETNQLAAGNGIRVPRELTMLGKTLLNLDLVGRALEPEFDPNASIRRNAADILKHRLLKSASSGNVFAGLLEMKDMIERLPGRLNRILDAIADNKLRVKVDTIDEDQLITGIQKVANRITLGLILAALIVGAALLMRVETSFQIFGYPGLAILCFLAAAGGGLALIIEILRHDRASKK